MYFVRVAAACTATKCFPLDRNDGIAKERLGATGSRTQKQALRNSRIIQKTWQTFRDKLVQNKALKQTKYTGNEAQVETIRAELAITQEGGTRGGRSLKVSDRQHNRKQTVNTELPRSSGCSSTHLSRGGFQMSHKINKGGWRGAGGGTKAAEAARGVAAGRPPGGGTRRDGELGNRAQERGEHGELELSGTATGHGEL